MPDTPRPGGPPKKQGLPRAVPKGKADQERQRAEKVPFTHARRGERFVCDVPALLEGALGDVAVTVTNVSITGTLLGFEDARFRKLEQRGQVQEHAALVEMHARAGLTLKIAAIGLGRTVHVVRWTSEGALYSPFSLGVRFDPPLDQASVDALSRLPPRAHSQVPPPASEE